MHFRVRSVRPLPIIPKLLSFRLEAFGLGQYLSLASCPRKEHKGTSSFTVDQRAHWLKIITQRLQKGHLLASRFSSFSLFHLYSASLANRFHPLPFSLSHGQLSFSPSLLLIYLHQVLPRKLNAFVAAQSPNKERNLADEWKVRHYSGGCRGFYRGRTFVEKRNIRWWCSLIEKYARACTKSNRSIFVDFLTSLRKYRIDVQFSTILPTSSNIHGEKLVRCRGCLDRTPIAYGHKANFHKLRRGVYNRSRRIADTTAASLRRDSKFQSAPRNGLTFTRPAMITMLRTHLRLRATLHSNGERVKFCSKTPFVRTCGGKQLI